MRVLIIYATVEGQTRKLANHAVQILENDGHQVQLIDAVSPQDNIKPDALDAVICMGSVHMGHLAHALSRFMSANASPLMARPGLLVTVSMAAATGWPDEMAELETMAANFCENCGWWPVSTIHVAGALKYTEYDFFRKWILKRISKEHDGPVDTSRDHEFTDWNAFETAIRKFVSDVPDLAGKI